VKSEAHFGVIGREGADSRLDLPVFRSMSDIPEFPKISAN